MRYLICIIVILMVLGCAGPSPGNPHDPDPPQRTANWDPGSEMGVQDLLVYFSCHWSDAWWGYDHPEICGLWQMVYDMIVHRELLEPGYVKALVVLQEAGGDGMDVPDELDIDPPC